MNDRLPAAAASDNVNARATGAPLSTAFRTLWSILWRIWLFFIVFSIVTIPFFVPVASMLEQLWKTSRVKAQLYSDAAGLVIMMTTTWIMTRLIDRRPFASIGFTARRMPRDLTLGTVAGTAWLATSIGVAYVAGWVSHEPQGPTSGALLLTLALSMLCNVATQELLLCGFTLQTIRTRTNAVTAVSVSALLFTAYHAPALNGAWLPAINVFAAGVLFCLAYVATENLWFPIAMHFAWNFQLGPLFGLTLSGADMTTAGRRLFILDGPQFFTGGAFGLEGGFIVTLTTAAAIAAAVFSMRRASRIETRSLDRVEIAHTATGLVSR